MNTETASGHIEQMKFGASQAGAADFRANNEDMKSFLESLKKIQTREN